MDKIQINIPEGFEIDQSKSDFSKGIIEFKHVEKKILSYEDVSKKLFKDNYGYVFESNSKVVKNLFNATYDYPLNATSKEQLECLMAYNKLRNVAEYLNKGWTPNWKNLKEQKWVISFSCYTNDVEAFYFYAVRNCYVYFASKELTEQAIEILGKEEIKKALFIY